MSSEMAFNIAVVVVLILFSAYFSATETAFTSANRIRMKNMAGDGDKKAERVLRLLSDYDKLLTTILVGNNIVNIGVTAFVTVICVDLFGAKGPTIATLFVAVVVLLFGEITPKSAAKEKAEAFSMFSAPFVVFLTTILTPVNFLFTKWKQLIAKIFKLHESEGISEDELMIMVEEAEESGGVSREHGKLIENAIEFDHLTAEDVMTPRPKIEAVEMDCPLDELAGIFRRTGLSRLPVYEEDIDRIIGVINQKDFHNYLAWTGKNLADYVMPVAFVSTSMRVPDLLRKMQQMKLHMAIVIDEYGGTEGLVTMEDIIEELVGEIFDEHDVVITQDIMPLQNGSFRIKGDSNISKMFDYFDIEEEVQEANTVNGWVVMQLDRLPHKGDQFTTIVDGKRLSVKVTKADDRRAKEINLTVEEVQEEDL
ncbi:MAG: hemolysin family protein [Firmicutes bacterium]|uniref:HlyC/CorC family transporter n=1 Tax=Lentihominibacter sp. TaxID=2944216 RepID=UPI002A589FAA|nr:hemolysin family protein [Lentihominibacter sp.]MCI5852889.1 hemolysin family protein [Clostridiales bacterium]MDD7319740.1 hemolysin family protein [Bacillota bacterium]MDY5287746.1 hemolysin family protein [Lentihominibacter sp.]